jgi:LCP family protein required for cell wall assembly
MWSDNPTLVTAVLRRQGEEAGRTGETSAGGSVESGQELPVKLRSGRLLASLRLAAQAGAVAITVGTGLLLGGAAGAHKGVLSNPNLEGPVISAWSTSPASIGPGTFHIMLLGTDRRPPQSDWRTDTMILVSIDPDQRTVSLVSIPRDLYVAIPGHGKTRLNMADNFGDADNYPGGGPGLLREMLEENVGLTFDRYIRIDFQGFVEAIDLLGGIDVDVRCPTELWVPNMKAPEEYLLLHSFSPGLHHMDGELALMYSRCRAHTRAFDRDRRQREVLLAVRKRVLELGIPGLLPKLFELLESMSLHVQTDLEPTELVALAQLMTELSAYGVSQGGIDLSVAPQWTTPDAAWVMRPERQQIKDLMAGRMIASSGEERALAAESVRIAVDNGTTIEGFGSQVADRLEARGYHVVEVGKADRLDSGETTIISYDGSSYTLERLCQYLGVEEDDVRYEPDWLSDVAIRIVLGSDAQPSCP